MALWCRAVVFNLHKPRLLHAITRRGVACEDREPPIGSSTEVAPVFTENRNGLHRRKETRCPYDSC
jgi:hypothetical protein